MFFQSTLQQNSRRLPRQNCHKKDAVDAARKERWVSAAGGGDLAGNGTAMRVRDAIKHQDLGQAVDSVSMVVDVHDVAVLVLTPV
jgi:hypothetical protein